MFSIPPLTPLVKKLLLVLLGAYVAELVLQNWVGLPIFEVFALHPGQLDPAVLWQLVTYIFVQYPGPQAVLGTLIGLFFLWLILAPFELQFGPKRTLQLVAVTTLAASAAAFLTGLLIPQGQHLYGFQAMLMGSIVGFAWSLRGRGKISFFGVLPLKALHIVWLVLGVSFLLFLASGNFAELAADLGAAGGGILFIRQMGRPKRRRRSSGAGPKPRKSSPFRVIEGGGDDDEPRWLN